MDRHPYLQQRRPIGFAHRGGAVAHPENTMRAFAHAVSLGFTHLETDVHITADGVAVAFHDDVLDRVTDQQGRIEDLPWSSVRRARVAGTEPICRLDELLDSFPDRCFNLDAKHDAAIEPLAEVIASTASVDRVCVGSFSDRRTAAIARLVGPELCISAGPRAVARLSAIALGAPLGAPAVHCAQVPPSVRGVPLITERFVNAAHRNGIAVHAWTIDEAAEIERLLDLGVDGIMTDDPGVLRDVFVERGHWPSS